MYTGMQVASTHWQIITLAKTLPKGHNVNTLINTSTHDREFTTVW